MKNIYLAINVNGNTEIEEKNISLLKKKEENQTEPYWKHKILRGKEYKLRVKDNTSINAI